MNTPNKSHDILARLLATENLTVIRKNVSTASFDIQNRVLVLPKWKKLTEAIEEMLILHEVGHALYTTPEGYGEVYVSKRHLRGYANILEDVRIEKKMKERYPGSRKSFNAGYTQLNDQDFFEVKDIDMNDMFKKSDGPTVIPQITRPSPWPEPAPQPEESQPPQRPHLPRGRTPQIGPLAASKP